MGGIIKNLEGSESVRNARIQLLPDREDSEDLPDVILPSGDVTITASAQKLFNLIGPKYELFYRGGAIHQLKNNDDGFLVLEILRASAARSLFEKHARLFARRSGRNGDMVLKPVNCPEDTAKALLDTEEARLLPAVRGLINCPIAVEENGKLRIVGKGYDRKIEMFITGGIKPPTVPLDEAVSALKDLLSDFDFQTPADRSRALASFITPALKSGCHLSECVPVDVAEADQSQSGKTYRQKVVAAIYNERLSLVTKRDGGVGSLDESFNSALIQGRPFIQIDNVRGKLNSQHLEAFLTAEGSFACRVPHRGNVYVDPSRYFVYFTSNGVETTRDFANRSSIIRIRKKPPNHVFRSYPEGSLLDHVKARQPYYLGCIFSILQEWLRLGKQRTSEVIHDFREWSQVIDWIIQNVMDEAPLMDGHQSSQDRVSNPALTFLRKICVAMDQQNELSVRFIASEIAELAFDNDIDIPGLRDESTKGNAARAIGILFGRLFKSSEDLVIDEFEIKRFEESRLREDRKGYMAFKSYKVVKRQSPTNPTKSI